MVNYKYHMMDRESGSLEKYGYIHAHICDPIWQNETEVAFWGIGVIIRS